MMIKLRMTRMNNRRDDGPRHNVPSPPAGEGQAGG
jgi:hypothetical protein